MTSSITNISAQKCSVWLGLDPGYSPSFVVANHAGDEVWDRCWFHDQPGACFNILVAQGLAPGAQVHRTVHWDQRSGPTGPPRQVPAGTYHFSTHYQNIVGQATVSFKPKPTTLVSKDLAVGTGPVATAASTVSVQYIGVNYDDGKEFDSSWAAGGKPVDFPLTGVIPGFSQGIVGMKVGGRRELVIPPDLGYGASGNGPVGPNETLVFVIDLVAVK